MVEHAGELLPKKYTPDFYLPDVNQWIEVKGERWKDNLPKFRYARAMGLDIRLLDKDTIVDFLGCGHFRLKRASRHGVEGAYDLIKRSLTI